MQAAETVIENIPPADVELVLRTLRGDELAFELIMRRHNRALYRAARSIVKNDAEAEDVVQETYVRAFARLDQFVGPQGFLGWLLRIAINEALTRVHRQQRFVALEDDTDAGPDADTNDRMMATMSSDLPDPERLAASSELRRLLEDAIDALPESFRTVFMLRDVEQMSTAETAEALGIRPETVKTRLHRGRTLLQKLLSEHIAASASAAFPFAGERCDRIVARVFARLGRSPTRSPRH